MAKLNTLEEKYIEQIKDVKQREKILNLLTFFKFIRKVSFTILDGYFSHNFISLNHYYFLFNLEKILYSQKYNQLLDNVNLFYTRTIYQSPENMYYHHEFARTLEKYVFSTYSNPKELIAHCINNQIDEKIEKTIQEDKDRIRGNELPHFGRIILKDVSKPVSLEKRVFEKICGGIIWNIPGGYYEADIYINIENLDSFVKVLDSVKTLYTTEKIEEKKFERFESISKNIMLKLLYFRNHEIDYRFDRRKFGLTSIMFNKDLMEELKQKIKYRIEEVTDKSFKAELKGTFSLINDSEASNSFIYIYSPSVIAKARSTGESEDKVESDFMLMAYNGEWISLKLAEIKTSPSKKRQKKRQIKNYLIYFLGIDEKLADGFAEHIKDGNDLKEDINDNEQLYGKLDGNKAILELKIHIPLVFPLSPSISTR